MTLELGTPEQIALNLNDTSNALVQDVEETARRVNEFRPLPSEVVKRIEDGLLGEQVYSSNAIEGNTLDLRETVMILKQGILGIRKKREALEAHNLGKAVRKITEWVDAGKSCHTSDKLREVHAIVLREIDDQWAGRYREHGVRIEGAKHQPPDYTYVASMIDRVMETLGQSVEKNTVLQAAWAHWAIARIHPFHDGNGRMARLWQDLVLFQGNLTCAIIRPEDRRQYLEALGQADEGDFNSLVQLVAQRISSTFDRYLIELQKEKEFDQFVEELVGEADARIDEERKLSYRRWSRMMEQLRSEFEFCASRITKASSDIQIQVRPYDLIDQIRWENIASGIGAKQTWFFTVAFFSRVRRLRYRYCFFFGKHFWSEELDNDLERREPRVCLLVSEDSGAGEAIRLDEMDNCPITLREIFVVNNGFVRKRMDIGTGEMVYDRDIPALRIAQEFMREIVLNRLT